jgi:N utilization substance protein B
MLNRRHIRIKVLQALYAAIQSEQTDIYQGQKQLMEKFDKIYDLAIYQLSFVLELRDFAEKRIEEAKLKHLPTVEDLNPSTRFLDNTLLHQIANNKDYKRRAKNLAINWSTEPDMIRKVFLNVTGSDIYKSYMSATTASYKQDKDFVLAIFEDIILPHESLHALFAEKNLHWDDDYNLSAEVVLMILSSYKEKWEADRPFPPLFKDDATDEASQDRAFASDLYKIVLSKRAEYDELIKPKITNWEIDRLAAIDRILIHMTLAEVLEMPIIPIKVSMNEYIDLSKYFSTPKSKQFINGILDHIIADLKAEGKISKLGRGLVD